MAWFGLVFASAQTEFRHISFEEAKSAAKVEGKLIFVDFYTQWCGPCKRMASTVFPKKEIGDYLNSGFVCLKLDAEAEGASLAKAVGVKAYPTLMVFDADGKSLGSFAGLKDGQEFITAVEMCKNPDLTPERVKQRYASGERTPELVSAYAINIVDSSRDYMAAIAQAGKVIDEYFDGLTDEQRLKPENHFLYDTYPSGFNSSRVQFMIANRNRFDASKSEDIAQLVKKQYKREAVRYFTSNSVTEDASRSQYDSFKASCKELGFDSELSNLFRFTDAHASMNLNSYVDYCDKNFDSLSTEEKGYLISNLSSIFTPANPEEVKIVTGFARKYIGSLPSDQLLWAAYAINELESPKH